MLENCANTGAPVVFKLSGSIAGSRAGRGAAGPDLLKMCGGSVGTVGQFYQSLPGIPTYRVSPAAVTPYRDIHNRKYLLTHN